MLFKSFTFLLISYLVVLFFTESRVLKCLFMLKFLFLPSVLSVFCFMCFRDLFIDACCCCCCFWVTQLCPIDCDRIDCSLPGSSVRGDSPGRITGVGCRAVLWSGSSLRLLHLLHWQAGFLCFTTSASWEALLGTCILTIVMSSWWIELFILKNCPSLSLVSTFVLNCMVSDIRTATPVLFSYWFCGIFFFCPFAFSLFVFEYKVCLWYTTDSEPWVFYRERTIPV